MEAQMIDWNVVTNILSLVAGLVVALLLHQSIPANKVKETLEALKAPVQKSPTQLDDLLLKVAETLNELRSQMPKQTASESQPPAKPSAEAFPKKPSDQLLE